MNRDQEYFKELSRIVEIEFESKSVNSAVASQRRKASIKSLKVSNFILRIGYVDRIITSYKVPILELVLNSTFITANECLVLASNPRSKQLQKLDLSCNPISVLGLLHLINPRISEFRNLRSLILFECDID